MKTRVLVLFATLLGSFSTLAIELKSPNGKIVFSLNGAASDIIFSVQSSGTTIVEPSKMVIELDGVNIAAGAKLGELESTGRSGTYRWRGAHSEATNNSRGLVIPCTGESVRFALELRAFDDGVAFRYRVPASDKPRTPDEQTVFTLPSGSVVWHHGLGGHYEDVHKKSDVSSIAPGEWIAPPMTFQLPNKAGYAAITEANLANYSGMALRCEGNRKFTIGLGHKHPISYPYRLRYSNDVDRVSIPAKISGEIISPWRVIMISRDLNGLVNSDIIHNLADEPDPKLFGDTAWIKPGRAIWKYLDGGANTFEDMKRFADWAGALGFEYNVLEGFWFRWSDDQLKELVNYSRERKVGLWLWRHSKELRTPEAREQFFTRLEKVGAVGAKIDFFDHEHKEVVDLYRQLLEGAARHKILVNFHGANKPTGEGRTFPNELTREAVRGMESSRLNERAIHDVTIPFTRLLAGPADYTPVHFGARRADTTPAHQIATAVIFSGPLLTYGAHPTNLLNSPALPLIKSIPAVWDETRVLEPSAIGEIAVFARRHGRDWFLAILNGPMEKKVSIPLTFLGDGRHKSDEFYDSADSPSGVLNLHMRGSTDVLDLTIPAGGGYVAHIMETASARRSRPLGPVNQ
jgi:alpha-glucosidase